MKLLLDTQVVLWAVLDSPRLGAAARQRIAEAEVVYVSAASIWEIAIKAALGKIAVDPQEIAGYCAGSGITELPVTARHAAATARLPAHHRDPFDRLLVAQALEEPLRLLTADRQLTAYSELVELA